MKTLALFLTLAGTSLAHAAETKIEFPLLAEEAIRDRIQTVKLSTLNPKLKQLGLPGFPERVAFGRDDLPWAKKLLAQTEKAGRALKRELELFQYGHTGYSVHELPETVCYRGRPADVLPVITALMGSVFNLDQGIQAVRYGKTKRVHPDYRDDFFGTNEATREEDEENNPDEVAMWDGYDTTSDSVLIMSDYGIQGDGVELEATLIPRCR